MDSPSILEISIWRVIQLKMNKTECVLHLDEISQGRCVNFLRPSSYHFVILNTAKWYWHGSDDWYKSLYRIDENRWVPINDPCVNPEFDIYQWSYVSKSAQVLCVFCFHMVKDRILKINLSSGKKKKMNSHRIKRNLHRICSRLQINVMCQTILEENVYWLSNEHRKTRKSR